ncbi:very short patch repair endonuclease [Gallaecimonas sp. GXIMD1310]|uniref:very short patch repair endonuclease n=1 Tax=Gallaecimonas sp. GXIMD1310 TaxID=3131926 RepID=UPI003873AFAD
MDIFSREKRHEIMSHISSKNSSAEIKVRRVLHRLGFRYRLYCSELPGRPDIVMKKYNLCIFVHGCFWHHHQGCNRGSVPKTLHIIYIHWNM